MPIRRRPADQTHRDALRVASDHPGLIGWWEWDRASDRIQADAFVAWLFNLAPEEAEAGAPPASFIAAIHPEDRPRVEASILRSAREGRSSIAEYRVRSADGITRWVLACRRFSRDANGRPLGGRGIIMDITQARAPATTDDAANPCRVESPLKRAADHVIAAQKAIVELGDHVLLARVNALLFEVGRKLAQQEIRDRRQRITLSLDL